jgi:hypothetical protein
MTAIDGRVTTDALQPAISPNQHINDIIQISTVESDSKQQESRTELDSHANMTVIGRHARILHDSGKTAEVSPFTPAYEALQSVPIVDAAIAYDCPFTDKTFILVCTNALSIPTMSHNLIPPFILREAGITVNDVPKIQVDTPSLEHHSLYFPAADLRIPLALWGIFSYFPCRSPTDKELDECDVVLLTPDQPEWNPHSDVYARNEENMLDWEGNMVETKDRVTILFPETEGEVTSTSISSAELY